jgi:TPR repeat protein
VEKDEKQAVEWFLEAAEQGLPEAQATLGWMYEHGRGVAKDEKKAAEWYRKAEEGHSRANPSR